MRRVLSLVIAFSVIGCSCQHREPQPISQEARLAIGGGMIATGAGLNLAAAADNGGLGLPGCVVAQSLGSALPPLGEVVISQAKRSPDYTGDRAISWCGCSETYKPEALPGLPDRLAREIDPLAGQAKILAVTVKDCKARTSIMFALDLIEGLPEQINNAVQAKTCRIEMPSAPIDLSGCDQ